MHRNTPGYDKIKCGKYVISDEDSSGALVPRERWLDFLQPGKRIGLSFIMRHPGVRDEKQCPRCRSSTTWLDDRPGQRRWYVGFSTPSKISPADRRRSLNCHLTYKVEDREKTRRYWKDLKVRPRRPKHQDGPSSAPSNSLKKPKKGNDEDSIKKPLKRQGTLEAEDCNHPYLRVHYQRDAPNRVDMEQPWKHTDPEFDKFLAKLPPLHRAAATGNVERLDEFLEDGEDGDAHWEGTNDGLYHTDRTGWGFAGAPPIHFAAYFGHTQAVLFLLSWLVDIDGRDSQGATALHAAAWTGNEKLFKLLIRKGASKTICDTDGWSVTTYAISRGHDNIPRLLIDDSEGDVETLVKMSKLRHAAKLGNTDVVLGMLLEDQDTGEDSNSKDMLFGEALIGAAEGGHGELA
ncbi:hypothetical protein GP486_007422, partial [Trichoglossum hirsutum]